jgi:hypothetical protein
MRHRRRSTNPKSFLKKAHDLTQPYMRRAFQVSGMQGSNGTTTQYDLDPVPRFNKLSCMKFAPYSLQRIRSPESQDSSTHHWDRDRGSTTQILIPRSYLDTGRSQTAHSGRVCFLKKVRQHEKIQNDLVERYVQSQS